MAEHERRADSRPETSRLHPWEAVLLKNWLLAIVLLAAGVFALAPADAAALGMETPPMTLIRLRADHVYFYYDRFVLEADGHVRVTTSDGMTMTGDAFSMDLKLNRFVLAGHVHMEDPSGSQSGAALADFLDFSRIYFVPIVEGANGGLEPDRWTFVKGDFAHPVKGLQMPGDTFFFPDLGKDKPFLKSTGAVIGSRSFVRFGGNHLDIANGLGAYIPTPSFYLNFSTDRHLGENSLAGANFDATWQFAGGANAISALHFRYDKLNKTYMSFEQHVSGKKAYAVFSVNPMTRPQKFWDLILSDQPSDRFQVRTFTQLATYQHWLREPDASGQFTILQGTEAMPHSSLQLNIQDTNTSLLPPGNHHGIVNIIDHPWQLALNAQGFDQRVGRTPVYVRFGYGLGYIHDGTRPLQILQGARYSTIWNHSVNFMAYVPSFQLGKSYIITKNYYLNASFEKSREWFSTPHHVDTTTTSLTLSKMFDNHFSGFMGYSVENLGDYYGKLQPVVYRSFVPVVNGKRYPGYAAFRGLATFRQLFLGVTYDNGGNTSASILARQHVDFPRPIPNFFQPPPLNNLGQPINAQAYLGEPPYDVTADVRVRINPHTSIDLSRTYYFNFGNRGWSNFLIQVLQ